MIQLLLSKIDNYLDDLAHNQWQRFVSEDGTIEIDSLDLLEEAVESMDMDELGCLKMIAESVEAIAALNRIFEDMESTVQEIAEDAAEWSRAQSQGIPGIMRYHGLSMSDFV